MTRKHFIEFANALKSHADYRETLTPERGYDPEFRLGYEAARADIGRSIASICRVHNENFDAVKFFEAAKLS